MLTVWLYEIIMFHFGENFRILKKKKKKMEEDSSDDFVVALGKGVPDDLKFYPKEK